MKYFIWVYLVSCFLAINNLGAATLSASYTYDKLDRLKTIELSGDNYLAKVTYTYDKSSNLVNVYVQVPGSESKDTDKDGLDDDWERIHFGNLSTADGTTDFDGDGYLDIWEYLNWAEGELDPDGYGFDPKVINAKGGRGYLQGLGGDFWTLMIPVILSSSQATGK